MKSIEMKKILKEWRRYRVEILSERNNPFGYKSQHPYEFIPVADELGEALYKVSHEVISNKSLITKIVENLDLKDFDIDRFISSVQIKMLSELNDLANSNRKLQVDSETKVVIFDKRKDYLLVILNLLQHFDENIMSGMDYDDNNMTMKYLDRVEWSSDTPVVISTSIGNILNIGGQKDTFKSMMWSIHDLLHRFEDYTDSSKIQPLFKDFKEKTGLEGFHQNRGEETLLGKYGSQTRKETGYYFDLESALGSTNWAQSLTDDVGKNDVYPTVIAGLCLVDLKDIDRLDLRIDTTSKIFREEYAGYIDAEFIKSNEEIIIKILKDLLKELHPVCLKYINDIVPKDFIGKCVIVPTQVLEDY